MAEIKITKRQMTALLTLWGIYQRTSLNVIGDGRKERLEFAGVYLHKCVKSYRDLSFADAQDLIRILKTAVGQADNPRRSRGRMRDRDRAHDAGTHGRRGYNRNHEVLVSAEDLARIAGAIARLGWTPERLQAWLRSRSSPLRGRMEIRTLADANKIWWALKNQLVSKGLWTPDDDVAPAPSPAGPGCSPEEPQANPDIFVAPQPAALESRATEVDVH
jgi:hypothetical protein